MKISEEFDSWLKRLSPAARNAVLNGLSVLAGMAVALMLHYLLYRVGLPSRPFIYVSF